MTRLEIPVTYNFRSVAGTAPGVLYRSDALAKVNREGRARLRGLGVRRVIDLRSDLDRRLGGADRLWGVGATLVKVPMLAGAKKSDVYSLTLERMYRDLLDRHAGAFGAVVREVAEVSGGAVVVHCTAGKDRSGVAAALIQLAVGVDEATVLEDYARTAANLEGEWADAMLRKLRRFRVERTPQLERLLTGSPVEALAATLEHLETAHGGLDAYLAHGGVTDAHRERLRMRIAEVPDAG